MVVVEQPMKLTNRYRSTAAPRATTTPIKVWAVIGALVLALEAYVLIAWIVSGNASPVDTGADAVPTYMKWFGHTWEVLGLIALVVFVNHYLIKPWRRERRLTLDGLFVLVFFTIYWQDPLYVYAAPQSNYNSMFWNLGSWLGNVPGVMTHNGERFAEPLLWTGPIYVYLVFGSVLVACWLMRKIRARWPGLSNVQLVLVCLAFFFPLDFIIEGLVVLPMGIYHYGGAIDWLTFNHGKYYQFPLYETLFWGTCWASFACLRFFIDDKGHTLVERGVDELRAPERRKTVMRFLALAGAVNVLFFVLYDVPMNVMGAHSDPWPADIEDRSYFTNEMCGPGTEYACAGLEQPAQEP